MHTAYVVNHGMIQSWQMGAYKLSSAWIANTVAGNELGSLQEAVAAALELSTLSCLDNDQRAALAVEAVSALSGM